MIRSPLGLFAVATAGGFGGLLFFWYRLFGPVEFDAVSLPVVALVGGVAATFNPCALPALPGFLARGRRPGEKSWPSALAACAGAATVVLAFGAVIAALGAAAEHAIEPPIHAFQLALGLVIAAFVLVHLANRADVIPLARTVAAFGARCWDAAMRRPGRRASYVFGAAFVAVGCT